jgi:hypothetical protein
MVYHPKNVGGQLQQLEEHSTDERPDEDLERPA